MGLLDRFKKEAGPDALTWEAVARARAVPGVAGAEAVDADTVHVTWSTHPGTTTLSLVEVRETWAKASGFARIELMDEVVAGLAPPTDPGPAPAEPAPIQAEPATAAPVAPAPDETSPPAPDPAPEAVAAEPPATAAWRRDRDRLSVVVGRQGAGAGVVRWPLAGGALEARAALDDADVGPSDLAAWGVGADEVRAAAVERLVAGDPGLDPIAPGQPAWVPTHPQAHPPAWLAAPERLLAACGLRQGVVLAPTSTELVLVDPSADGILATVLSGTKGIVAEASDVLLAAPLLATPEGVAPWVPDPEHPCARLVAELRDAT